MRDVSFVMSLESTLFIHNAEKWSNMLLKTCIVYNVRSSDIRENNFDPKVCNFVLTDKNSLSVPSKPK